MLTKHDFKNWFEFGIHPNGNVSIANVDGDIEGLGDVSPDLAKRIIKAYNNELDKIETLWREEMIERESKK